MLCCGQGLHSASDQLLKIAILKIYNRFQFWC
jgi:hypothetical protein